MFKTFLILILMFILSNCVQTQTATQTQDTQTLTQKRNDCSLISQLKVEFKKQNERIENVKVVDVRPTTFGDPKYFVVGWGIRADWSFKGDFSDELFALFIVDESLQRVEKVVDFIPTPRWGDTQVRIKSADADYIVLEGTGMTYGGTLLKRKYKWRE